METKDNKWILYMHEFPNGKVYIGITSQSAHRRWRNDGSGYEHQLLMNRAIAYYGWDNIIHDILAIDLTLEEAKLLEQEWVAYYESNNPKYGYNRTQGGDTVTDNPYWLGKQRSAESCKKISDTMKEKYRNGYKNPNLGVVMSEDSRQKMSKARQGKSPYNKGKALSEEHRQKLSESHKGVQAGGKNPNARAIVQLDKDTGVLIKTWDCMNDAARGTGICITSIAKVCRCERSVAGGFKWVYLDNYGGGVLCSRDKI